MLIIKDKVNDKKGYSILTGTLEGSNRDDQYVIKKFSSSFTEIDDADGFDSGDIYIYEDFGHDMVVVENVKPDDLTLFFDYSIGDYDEVPESRPSDELYIVKKSALSSMISTTSKGGKPKSNGILITSQFGDTNDNGNTMSFGAIEDLIIHDTKTDIGRRIYMSETMEATKAQVKALLEEVAEKGLYTKDLETHNEVPILSAFQLLASNHKTYKNRLINIFKNQLIHTEIYDTSENDKIVGGKGNDEIYCEDGNDTITGGLGKNTIYYGFTDDIENNSGNDVINLTKGENLVIDIAGADIGDLHFEYSKNKKDLIIYKGKDDEGNFVESITLKNFASKDVTNNANSKKKIENTSSVIIKAGLEGIDLRKDLYLTEDNIINVFKNYTGTWLDEDIFAVNYEPIKGTKGLTLDGKGGNDIIDGSKYADVIKGGDGNDTIDGDEGDDKITGGKGENTIKHFVKGGNDIIYLTKGETLNLEMIGVDTLDDLTFTVAKNKKDLEISRKDHEGEKVTLKNYYSKELGATVNINGENLAKTSVFGKVTSANYFEATEKIKKSYTGSALTDVVDAKDLSKPTNTKTLSGVTINTKGGDDTIVGSNYADTLKGGNGDDEITGGKGNDKLYGEAGENTLYFEANDGDDIVYGGKGEDTLVFKDVNFNDLKFSRGTTKSTKNDLVIEYTENDSVTVKNFFKLDKKKNPTSSVKRIVTTDKTLDFDSILIGTAKNDILTPANGNNYIFASEGDDTIKSGVGVDTLVFANESLEDHDSPATIKATWIEDSEDLIITAENSRATMVLKDYGLGNHSAQWIIVGDEKVRIDSIVGQNIVNFDGSTPLARGTSRSDGIEINSVGTHRYPTYISSLEGDDIINLTNVVNFGVDAGKGNDVIIMNGNSYGEVRLVKGNGDDTFYGIENANSRYSVILNAQIEGSQGAWLGDDLLLRKAGNHEFILGEQDGDNLIIKLTSGENFTVVDYFKSRDNFEKLKFVYRTADGEIEVRSIIAYLLPEIPTVVDLDLINNTYEDSSDKMHVISATEEGLYNVKLGDGSNNQVKIGSEEADELLEAQVNIELGNGDNNFINLFKTGSYTGVTVGDGNYNYIYMSSTYNEDVLPPNTHAKINVGHGDGNEVDIWNDGRTILNIGNGQNNYVYTYGNGNTIINSSVDTDTDDTILGSCYFGVGKNSRENCSTTTITSYGNDTICGSGTVNLYIKNGTTSEKLVETNFRDRKVETKSRTTVNLDNSSLENKIQIGVNENDYTSYISFNKTSNNSYDFVYGAMDSNWNEVDGEILIKNAYIYNENESEWQFRFDKDVLFKNQETEETHGLANEYELYFMDKMNHYYDMYELPNIDSKGVYIKGSESNDEYWYEFENLTIKEKGGEDTLTIDPSSGTQNFKFFYDIDKDGNVGNDLIFAAEYSGYTQFSNLFSIDEDVRNSANYLTIKDYFLTEGGSIENIYTKDISTDVKLSYDALVRKENFTWGGTDAETKTIIQNVIAWLQSNNSYESAMDAIENCQDQNVLNDLMSCYSTSGNNSNEYWVEI